MLAREDLVADGKARKVLVELLGEGLLLLPALLLPAAHSQSARGEKLFVVGLGSRKHGELSGTARIRIAAQIEGTVLSESTRAKRKHGIVVCGCAHRGKAVAAPLVQRVQHLLRDGEHIVLGVMQPQPGEPEGQRLQPKQRACRATAESTTPRTDGSEGHGSQWPGCPGGQARCIQQTCMSRACLACLAVSSAAREKGPRPSASGLGCVTHRRESPPWA